MDKQFRLILLIAIGIITFSVFYYFVIFLPKAHQEETGRKLKAQQEEKLKAQQEEIDKNLKVQQGLENKQDENKIHLQNCLSETFKVYVENWDKACYELTKLSDCKLPSNISNRLDQNKKDLEERCFKLYPVK